MYLKRRTKEPSPMSELFKQLITPEVTISCVPAPILSTERSRTWTSRFASISSRIMACAPSAVLPSTATSSCAPSATRRCATCAPPAIVRSTPIGKCAPTAARASNSAARHPLFCIPAIGGKSARGRLFYAQLHTHIVRHLLELAARSFVGEPAREHLLKIPLLTHQLPALLEHQLPGKA